VPRFEYSGRDRSGGRVSGAVEAGSLDAAVSQLFEQGVTPLEVNEREARARGGGIRHQLGLDQPDRGEVILFTRQMYALTRSGVPLIRGLTQLAESTRNPVLASAIQAVIGDLEAGRELAGALARHPRIFKPLYVAIIRVGEQSGRLEEAFQRMYRYLEGEQETVQRIKSATRYPMFVIIAMLIAIFVLMTYVIPVFAGVFERFDAELPMPTRVLIAISGFFAGYWWLILGLAALGWIAFRQWRQTEAGQLKWDRRKLGFPVVGDILLRATLARFARAFSMAHRSGVPILEAMNVVASAVDNAWITRKVLDMREGIERGEALSRVAARADVFTPLVIQIDDMVDEVADFYEREVDYDVKNLSTLIEPILTVGIGILVFLLALGIFLPMWELGSAALGNR
jgi:MSHA biogenesis protein MshG